jgi:hypothetical protein
MGRPVLLRCVLLFVAVLSLQPGPVLAARGNSLRHHVLYGVKPQPDAALPAWQHLETDEVMDIARRLLEEYALNAAEEDPYAIPPHPPAADAGGDEITQARLQVLDDELAQEEAAEEFPFPQGGGDEITRARLMLEEYGQQAEEDNSFLDDALATVKNLDEQRRAGRLSAEAQVPAVEDLWGVLDSVQEPAQLAAEEASTQPQLPQGSGHAGVQEAPAQAVLQEAPAQPAGHAAAPVSGQEDDTAPAMRKLLEELVINTTQSVAPGLDIRPALQEVAAALVTAGALLKEHAAPAQEASAVALASEDASTNGRRLMQAGAVSVQTLREEAKAALVSSDAFGMVYTGGNFARAIFMLLVPMVVAGQTGTVTVDANYILNLSQLLAQLIATLGDLLSKGARLMADGIAPV